MKLNTDTLTEADLNLRVVRAFSIESSQSLVVCCGVPLLKRRLLEARSDALRGRPQCSE
jgi:hypothetical protein